MALDCVVSGEGKTPCAKSKSGLTLFDFDNDFDNDLDFDNDFDNDFDLDFDFKTIF